MFNLGSGRSTGQIVKSVTTEGAIVSTAHYTAEECGRGTHYHENPHICFLFQGGDVERCENRSYQRNTGDVFFYHAGEKHASVSRPCLTKQTNIEFEPVFLSKYGLSEMQIDQSLKSNPYNALLIMKVQREMLFGDELTSLPIDMLLLDLVGSKQVPRKRTPPKWVRNVEAFLNDYWNETVTLEQLSVATDAHPVTISKNFRKYFSCTLGEYLRKLKVQNSIPLIKNAPMSLTDIAHHCGFTDQSHFTRVFIETTGFRPSEFRRT